MTEATAAPVDLTKSGILAALGHETSKEYAAKARSRILPPWANAVLLAASEGKEVDVVKFRKAATQALSAAATRAGQSMGRRAWTREARHLIYWADAIIDNHIAGLPPYEGGPRSPRIAELSLEVEHAGLVNQSLTRDLTDAREKLRVSQQERSHLTQAASDERRRLCKQYDDLKAAANDEVSRLLEVAGKRDTLLAETVAERDVLASVVNYIVGALGETDRARVFGYWDALNGE